MIDFIKQLIVRFIELQVFVLLALLRLLVGTFIGFLTGLITGSIVSSIITLFLWIISLFTNYNLEQTSVEMIFTFIILFLSSIFMCIGFLISLKKIIDP